MIVHASTLLVAFVGPMLASANFISALSGA
jgi:hypothetical protein